MQIPLTLNLSGTSIFSNFRIVTIFVQQTLLIKDGGYNGLNVVVYSFEFLDMLRY
jgi:hypothetical protein